jgi:glycosyltransferase involved in cell wall biosynthesis
MTSILAEQSAIAVSVVVPTYRRFDLLDRCLTALCAQDFAPTRFEVIVADDDADDRRSALMRTWLERKYGSMGNAHRFRYIWVTQTQGPAGARNQGWRAARGDVIAFTDDDTVPAPTWLSRGMAAIGQGWDAVGGRIVMPLSAEPTDYERDASGLSRAEFATANCFVRRAALEAVDGFDEGFTSAWREDSDLQFALLESGFKCGAAPDAVVVHPIRPARWGISISQQRKILFDALLFKKHRALYRAHIRRFPPWRYYAIVGALLVSIVSALFGASLLAIVALLIWSLLTWRFAVERLDGTSHAWKHILEMIFTSIAIPAVAVFWRLVGAARFRVPFL